jgi:uncharacterized protein DUF4352
MEETPRRKWNGWDVLLWLIAWPWALMRLIGRHARWSASASNWAGVGATIAFVVILAALSSSSTTTTTTLPSAADTSGSTQSEPTATEDQPSKPACVNEANGDCTPHVGAHESVRVDALEWSVQSTETATNIGADEYSDGVSPDGVFLIVHLSVHSDKDESADLVSIGQDSLVALSGGGTQTAPSDEGSSAVEIYGHEKSLAYATISPDSTKTGVFVFDVPQSRLTDDLELRVNELGLGPAHGYIHLPSPAEPGD